MKRRAGLALVAVLALGAPGLAGCDGVFGPSKVARGERYSAGDARFDGFFEAVHKEQEAAKGWPEDKARARKSLVTLTGVREGSNERTLVSAVRERAKGLNGSARLEMTQPRVASSSGAKEDAPLFSAIEETARREIERARKLAAAADRLEALEKKGKELAKEADEDRRNAGADKADEKKAERRRELRRELGGAIDVVSDLAKDARKGIADAEKLLDDLDAALQGKDHVTPPEGRVFPPPSSPPREERPAAKHEPKKHEPKPKPASPAKPAPTTKPPPPPEGEVFNP